MTLFKSCISFIFFLWISTVQASSFSDQDFPDLIPEAHTGLRTIENHNFASVWGSAHLSKLSELKLVGSGIQDEETGNLSGIACVGEDPDQSSGSTCKVLRKFYYVEKSNHLFFFSYGYLNPGDTESHSLKSTVEYILLATRINNMGNTKNGGTSDAHRAFYTDTLENASISKKGWSWSSNPIITTHRKFEYFTESFGMNWKSWNEIQE